MNITSVLCTNLNKSNEYCYKLHVVLCTTRDVIVFLENNLLFDHCIGTQLNLASRWSDSCSSWIPL